jgi:hypothetical protein
MHLKLSLVPACLATGIALRRDKTVRQVDERMIYETPVLAT